MKINTQFLPSIRPEVVVVSEEEDMVSKALLAVTPPLLVLGKV